MKAFLLHLHPKKISSDALQFKATFGLGGACAFLLFLACLSGIILTFPYKSDVTLAYGSVTQIQYHQPFGSMFRNMHRWAGEFLILFSLLHMIRVLIHSAATGPRKVNWVVGMFLLLMVFLVNFTGYLLPWDQLSYWAVTICIGMLDYFPVFGQGFKIGLTGHGEIGQQTLTTFYVLHIVLIPLILLGLSLLHFWFVRKAGGVKTIPSIDRTNISSDPYLVRREFAFAMVLMASLLVFGLVIDAPLLEKANPGLSPNPTKAPWFLMGIQELMLHLHPSLAIFWVPLFVLGLLFVLPTYKGGGKSFDPKKNRVVVQMAGLITLVFMLAWIIADSMPGFMDLRPFSVPQGILPIVAFLIIFGAYLVWCRRRFKIGRKQVSNAIITCILVAWMVLTLVGTLFRGRDMTLGWFHG